jgi:hypothetical protein
VADVSFAVDADDSLEGAADGLLAPARREKRLRRPASAIGRERGVGGGRARRGRLAGSLLFLAVFCTPRIAVMNRRCEAHRTGIRSGRMAAKREYEGTMTGRRMAPGPIGPLDDRVDLFQSLLLPPASCLLFARTTLRGLGRRYNVENA